MRNRLIGSILGLVGVLALSLVLLARTVEQSGSAKAQNPASPPDLSGVWVLHPPATASAYSSFAFSKDEPSMTP